MYRVIIAIGVNKIAKFENCLRKFAKKNYFNYSLLISYTLGEEFVSQMLLRVKSSNSMPGFSNSSKKSQFIASLYANKRSYLSCPIIPGHLSGSRERKGPVRLVLQQRRIWDRAGDETVSPRKMARRDETVSKKNFGLGPKKVPSKGKKNPEVFLRCKIFVIYFVSNLVSSRDFWSRDK